MTARANRLAAIFGQLRDGELTDSEAGKRADLALAAVSPRDVRAAYWTGRLEEATGIELWPYET